MISPFPERLIIFYNEWQPLYETLSENIEFYRDINDAFYESLSASQRNLVILDDQMMKVGGSKILQKLFTEGSHHRNLTVVYIVQNLFSKEKSHRTVSLNTQYIVLFKNPRDKSQITTISRQMFPNRTRFLTESFEDATRQAYGYLVLDLRADSDEDIRVKTNIFPGEDTTIYKPRNT